MHNADVLVREDITVDDFIDVIDGNRKYCKCALSLIILMLYTHVISKSCFSFTWPLREVFDAFVDVKRGIYVYNKWLRMH